MADNDTDIQFVDIYIGYWKLDISIGVVNIAYFDISYICTGRISAKLLGYQRILAPIWVFRPTIS